MNTYPLGQTIDLGPWTLRDSSDALVVASASECTVTLPDATTATPTVTTSSTGIYSAAYTPSTQTGIYTYRAVLTLSDGSVAVNVDSFFVGALLADLDDVAARLGLTTATLTDAQARQAGQLIEAASLLVADACGKDEDWIIALTAVPMGIRGLVTEVVARAMSAPLGVRSQSLGQWSESYPDQLAQGVQLTKSEELRARRITFGSNSGSSTPASVLDDLYDLTS